VSKYNRTYHLPWSPGATSDDKVSKSIDNLIGIDIIITEKLDGENCGMTNDGIYARSHATFTTSAWSREVRQIHDIKVRGQLDDNVYLFGENMEGVHSIEYSNLKSYFYLFGVRDNNIWIPWQSVEEYAYLLDLELVPVLFKGKVNSEKELKDLVNDLVSKPSDLGGEREGIVVRNAGLFHNDDFADNVMKWVRANHVTTDEHWTRNWKKSKIEY
jgi:hypothetical protein